MALPDGLQFLKAGWWVVHFIAIMFAYQYGFARGRGQARREQRQRDMVAKRG